MCGRFTQTGKDLPGLSIANLDEMDLDAAGLPPPAARYNGAPSQDFWVIRRHPATGASHCGRLVWGLIPHWVKEAGGGRKPINARAETVSSLPSFRAAYASPENSRRGGGCSVSL